MLVVKEEKAGFDIFIDVFYSGSFKIKYDTEYVKNLYNWLSEKDKWKDKWDEFEDILRDAFPNGTNLDEYHSYLIDNYKDIGEKMGFTN
jgi:hypothetical protein